METCQSRALIVGKRGGQAAVGKTQVHAWLIQITMMLMMLKTYLIRLREVKGGCCTMYSVHSGGDSAQLGY